MLLLQLFRVVGVYVMSAVPRGDDIGGAEIRVRRLRLELEDELYTELNRRETLRLRTETGRDATDANRALNATRANVSVLRAKYDAACLELERLLDRRRQENAARRALAVQAL